MPPIRTQPTPSTSASASSPASTSKKSKSATGKQLPKPKRPHSASHKARGDDDGSSPVAVPGVQKIKAALRQTRRLLAKDKLAADVRVATERRLRALEADLARAEQARKERTIAARYHKIKFFERQKVSRKLAQTKRKLTNDSDALSEKERKRLEKSLLELRVDLNYILHYPKTKKYISLFPPEVRHQTSSAPSHSKDATSPDPHNSPTSENNPTDAQRAEIRKWIKEQMAEGALSAEPEVELARGERTARKKMVGSSRADAGASGGTEGEGVEGKKGGVVGDAFFEEDEEDDSEASEDENEEMDDDAQ